MNKERDTTTLGVNMETNTIDVLQVDDQGNVLSSAPICPVHPDAVDGVIAILQQIKTHIVQVTLETPDTEVPHGHVDLPRSIH